MSGVIQTAIDALPASGGVVRIKPGIYTENIVSTKPAVTLIGDGQVGPRFTILYSKQATYNKTIAPVLLNCGNIVDGGLGNQVIGG